MTELIISIVGGLIAGLILRAIWPMLKKAGASLFKRLGAFIREVFGIQELSNQVQGLNKRVARLQRQQTHAQKRLTRLERVLYSSSSNDKEDKGGVR